MWISKQVLHLILVMKQRNTLPYKKGKIWSPKRAAPYNVLRTGQAGPVVEQVEVYDQSSSFLCFFLLFQIAKCCLFVVVFKTHPVIPSALSGVQVQNTMYSYH